MLQPSLPARSGGAPLRVAIVGGGAAGISVASHLRAVGVGDVTVFEREARLGGKCCSVVVDGNVYELGAALVAPGYSEVNRLLKRHGLTTAPLATSGRCGFYDVEQRALHGYSVVEQARLLWHLMRFFGARRRCADWSKPGFADIPAHLGEPFETWLHRHGLSQLQQPLEAFLTGYGYGYAAEVPAAYALKYFEPAWTLPALLGRGMRIIETGYQSLVERMAEGLNLRLGVRVEGVARDQNDLWLRLGNGSEERFDVVILATAPLPPSFLTDVDPELASLMADVRHYSYHTVAAVVPEMPGSVVFLPKHFRRPAGDGRMVFGYHRHPSVSPLAVLHGLAAHDVTDDEVRDALRHDAERLGGKPGPVLAHRRWRYFPHVGCAGFKRGVHRRLEEAQGLHGVYFVGELMSFPTVEHVCRYSRHFVARHFAPPGVHA